MTVRCSLLLAFVYLKVMACDARKARTDDWYFHCWPFPLEMTLMLFFNLDIFSIYLPYSLRSFAQRKRDGMGEKEMGKEREREREIERQINKQEKDRHIEHKRYTLNSLLSVYNPFIRTNID